MEKSKEIEKIRSEYRKKINKDESFVLIAESGNRYSTWLESQTAELRNKLQDSEANRGLEEVENSDLRGANMKLREEEKANSYSLGRADAEVDLENIEIKKLRKEVQRLEGEVKLYKGTNLSSMKIEEQQSKIQQLQKENEDM